MSCCSSETFTVLEYGSCGESKPVNLQLTRGLKPRIVLNVIATTNKRTRFDIKDCHGNVLLHINPRIDENVIVINSYTKGLPFDAGWGTEERPSQMPVKCDIKYFLLIAHESNGYRIFINGEELHFFKHRINNPATEFEIHDGHVYSLSYKQNEPRWAIQQSINGVYVQEFGCGKETPHEIQLQGSNTLSWVQITGHVNSNASRFDVDLLNSCRDGIFHFNPRFGNFGEHCVVRNSCMGDWGEEERKGGLPFKQNQKFVLAIVVETQCYRTYVNGEEFITYNHRAPANTVTILNISKDVKLFKIIYHK